MAWRGWSTAKRTSEFSKAWKKPDLRRSGFLDSPEKLREEAAKLGGDAVVVVYDHIQPVAAYVTGPLWSRDIETIQGRKLKGIVIKYQ